MKNTEKLPLFGYRGKTYFFNVYPLQADYPAEAGVYLFTKREPAPNAIFTIISIGHTSHFPSISELPGVETGSINTICLLRMDNADDRLATVAELAERYGLICNEGANS